MVLPHAHTPAPSGIPSTASPAPAPRPSAPRRQGISPWHPHGRQRQAHGGCGRAGMDAASPCLQGMMPLCWPMRRRPPLLEAFWGLLPESGNRVESWPFCHGADRHPRARAGAPAREAKRRTCLWQALGCLRLRRRRPALGWPMPWREASRRAPRSSGRTLPSPAVMVITEGCSYCEHPWQAGSSTTSCMVHLGCELGPSKGITSSYTPRACARARA